MASKTLAVCLACLRMRSIARRPNRSFTQRSPASPLPIGGERRAARLATRHQLCRAYYSNIDDVVYTPAYDIVTTAAYPRFANNPPGLSIEGRKTWAPGKTLERFFNTRLGIPPKQYREMVEALCDSAVSTGKDIVEAAKNETRWRWIAKQMLHAWNEGMGSLRSAKPQVALKGLTPIIEAAGFSDADQADNAREVIGRSELLANHGKEN